MSGAKRTNAILAVIVSAFLWERAIAALGSVLPVIRHAIAGVIAGIALVWIFREFASMSNTRSTIAASAAGGICIVTPLIAMLALDSTDTSGSANVVLAFAAAAVAAMSGAIWGMASLAHDAFSEWRRERSSETRQLTLGGVHR